MVKPTKLVKTGRWAVKTADGSAAATVEIPTPFSRGALVTIRQAVWGAAELRRLAAVLVKVAEALGR